MLGKSRINFVKAACERYVQVSAWTAAADAGTTSSLNGCGGPSNTITFSCVREPAGDIDLRETQGSIFRSGNFHLVEFGGGGKRPVGY
jgi:hypothetical protein